MKLIERLNRAYLLFSAAVVICGMVLFYLFISRIVQEELDDGLQKDLKRITIYLENGMKLPNIPPVLEVRRMEEPINWSPVFTDTLLYDPAEKEQEPFRQLTANIRAKGLYFAVCLRAPRVERHDFILAVGTPTAIILTLLLGGLFWFNRSAQRRLWQPFSHTLSVLKMFSVAQPVSLPDTGIDEFDALNRAVEQLTEKIRSDFQNLKEYTENASHEIQTPLAIIRAKTEWLLQVNSINTEHKATISAIYLAANRLSKLNQGLILLAKIENLQFEATERIPLLPVLHEQIVLLEDIVQTNGFIIDLQATGNASVSLHPVLAEILIKNLLENALRYSMPGSVISIQVTANQLVFSNPGRQSLGPTHEVFRRFARRKVPSGSPGLGLAIVKKICDVSGIAIRYTFSDNRHLFALAFSE